MAEEASLDDFFAKKDKSKKKTKSKIKPDDILAQQDQDDAPKKTKKKKSKEKTENSNPESKKANEEDQEWKDYEVEEVDYSGLRIKELQINKDEEEQEEEEGKEEEGEGRERKEGGPWNKMDGSEGVYVPERAPTPEPKPKPKPAEESKPSTGKYIPPSRRGEGAAVVQAPTQRRKKKEAPNLHSEHDFPTLGGADYSQGGEFEEVRSGGRQSEDPTKQRVNLQLDNKFGALQSEES